jgi:hypothetical protein
MIPLPISTITSSHWSHFPFLLASLPTDPTSHFHSHVSLPIEEPGEQCNIVFALIVTEPASECEGGLQHSPSPFPLAGSVQFMQGRQCIVI